MARSLHYIYNLYIRSRCCFSILLERNNLRVKLMLKVSNKTTDTKWFKSVLDVFVCVCISVHDREMNGLPPFPQRKRFSCERKWAIEVGTRATTTIRKSETLSEAQLYKSVIQTYLSLNAIAREFNTTHTVSQHTKAISCARSLARLLT